MRHLRTALLLGAALAASLSPAIAGTIRPAAVAGPMHITLPPGMPAHRTLPSPALAHRHRPAPAQSPEGLAPNIARPAQRPYFNEGHVNNIEPSDSTRADGATTTIDAVNDRVTLRSASSSSTIYWQGTMEQIAGDTGGPGATTDPTVEWVPQSGQLEISFLEHVTTHQWQLVYLASKGPDPRSPADFCGVHWFFGNGDATPPQDWELFDFPEMGGQAGNDGNGNVVIGGNAFVNGDTSGFFTTAQLLTFKRPVLAAGAACPDLSFWQGHLVNLPNHFAPSPGRITYPQTIADGLSRTLALPMTSVPTFHVSFDAANNPTVATGLVPLPSGFVIDLPPYATQIDASGVAGHRSADLIDTLEGQPSAAQSFRSGGPTGPRALEATFGCPSGGGGLADGCRVTINAQNDTLIEKTRLHVTNGNYYDVGSWRNVDCTGSSCTGGDAWLAAGTVSGQQFAGGAGGWPAVGVFKSASPTTVQLDQDGLATYDGPSCVNPDHACRWGDRTGLGTKHGTSQICYFMQFAGNNGSPNWQAHGACD